MSMNQTKKLPDAYRKDTDSNNYKLMQLCNLLNTDFSADVRSIFHSRDIHNATGKTLDKYGEMIGQSRNGATDEQYRFLILYKISRLKAESDCNSVILSLSQMFNAEHGVISISEYSSGVQINGITIEMAESTGFTMTEIENMVSDLLPIGVSGGRTVFSGTLLVNSKYKLTGNIEAINKYPVLYSAWYYSQFEYINNGKDVGLSGYGEVPEIFNADYGFPTSGTYAGGTLSAMVV